MFVIYYFLRICWLELIDDNNYYNCYMLYIYLRYDGF